jgi:hypothetical protein
MTTRPIHDFAVLLGLLSRGRVLERLNEELGECLETLAALPGEKGTASINLTLSFSYQSGRVDVKPTIKAKLPEDKGFTDTPFWEHEGGLSVQHPSQMDFGLQEVPTARRSSAAEG